MTRNIVLALAITLAIPTISSADQIEDANKVIDAQDEVIEIQGRVIDLQREQINHLSVGLDESLKALSTIKTDNDHWYRDPLKVAGATLIAREIIVLIINGVKK